MLNVLRLMFGVGRRSAAAGVGFGAEALKLFEKAVFIPAFRDGKPTASKTTATFYFPHL
jgi:hypothetical protein